MSQGECEFLFAIVSVTREFSYNLFINLWQSIRNFQGKPLKDSRLRLAEKTQAGLEPSP